MRKKLNNNDLLNLGSKLSDHLNTASDLWKAAMKVYPISSSEYKAICNSGSKIQSIYHNIKNQAEEVLSDSEIEKHFTVRGNCHF